MSGRRWSADYVSSEYRRSRCCCQGLAGTPALAQSTYLDPITVVASRTEEVVIRRLRA